MKLTGFLWDPVLDRDDSVIDGILIQLGDLGLVPENVDSSELMVLLVDGAPGSVCRWDEGDRVGSIREKEESRGRIRLTN